MFSEVLRQVGIRQNLVTAHHPHSQGALEKFHSTAKLLLRAYCVELDHDWEEGLALADAGNQGDYSRKYRFQSK